MATTNETGCTLLGCTLGKAHEGRHLGPLCPRCKNSSHWFEDTSSWDCTDEDCSVVEVQRVASPALVPSAPAEEAAGDYADEACARRSHAGRSERTGFFWARACEDFLAGWRARAAWAPPPVVVGVRVDEGEVELGPGDEVLRAREEGIAEGWNRYRQGAIVLRHGMTPEGKGWLVSRYADNGDPVGSAHDLSPLRAVEHVLGVGELPPRQAAAATPTEPAPAEPAVYDGQCFFDPDASASFELDGQGFEEAVQALLSDRPPTLHDVQFVLAAPAPAPTEEEPVEHVALLCPRCRAPSRPDGEGGADLCADCWRQGAAEDKEAAYQRGRSQGTAEGLHEGRAQERARVLRLVAYHLGGYTHKWARKALKHLRRDIKKGGG